MYVFDHIYKTAGTTFNLAYLPGAFEQAELFVLRGFRNENLEDLNAVEKFSEEQLRRLKVIAGHNAGQLRDTFSGETRFLTLVREPKVRLVSGYVHALLHVDAYDTIGRELQESGIGLSRFVEEDLFAKRYADFVSVHNGQARVVLGADDLSEMPRSNEWIRERIRSRFHLVGYTEAFELFLFMLHVTEGFPLSLFTNRLVRPERSSWPVTDADLATIERYTRLDQQVYECVRQEFDQKVAAIWTPALGRQYEAYVRALREFQEDSRRINFLSSVRFAPV